MNTVIVNSTHLPSILEMEARQHRATDAQQAALKWLIKTGMDRNDIEPSRFLEMEVQTIEDMLVVMFRECYNMQPVVNGAWMRCAVEQDGYCVVTSNRLKGPVTTYPTVTT